MLKVNRTRRSKKLPHQRLDGTRQVDILLGDAALRVGGERQSHLIVADVDIGVMVGGLRSGADAVDEGERGGEIGNWNWRTSSPPAWLQPLRPARAESS